MRRVMQLEQLSERATRTIDVCTEDGETESSVRQKLEGAARLAEVETETNSSQHEMGSGVAMKGDGHESDDESESANEELAEEIMGHWEDEIETDMEGLDELDSESDQDE